MSKMPIVHLFWQILRLEERHRRSPLRHLHLATPSPYKGDIHRSRQVPLPALTAFAGAQNPKYATKEEVACEMPKHSHFPNSSEHVARPYHVTDRVMNVTPGMCLFRTYFPLWGAGFSDAADTLCKAATQFLLREVPAEQCPPGQGWPINNIKGIPWR